MTGFRWVLYGVGFLAELVAWAGCGATAFLWLSGWVGWVVAVAIALVVIIGWGVFMAPKATLPLRTGPYYAIKAVIYVWSAVLWAVLLPWVAIAFVVMVAVSEPALFRRRQEEFAGPS